MTSNPYAGQLEQQVMGADPVELVRIMFDHLVAAVQDARQHLLAGDRMARGRALAKALGLLGELSQSLDVERGGELAANLQQLYAFIAGRLVEAQAQQTEQPLTDALQALRPLRDAWQELDHSRSEGLAAPSPIGAPDAGSGLDFSLRLSA